MPFDTENLKNPMVRGLLESVSCEFLLEPDIPVAFSLTSFFMLRDQLLLGYWVTTTERPRPRICWSGKKTVPSA